MSRASDQLMQMVQQFQMEDDKFEGGNNAAGTRARKALMEIKKFCDQRRKDIQNAKNAG